MTMLRFLHSLLVLELRSLFLGNNCHVETLLSPLYQSVGGDERGRDRDRDRDRNRKRDRERKRENGDWEHRGNPVIILSSKTRES